jgi:hypothetical protein
METPVTDTATIMDITTTTIMTIAMKQLIPTRMWNNIITRFGKPLRKQ